MQIAVCDDQEEILKQLKKMLSRFTLVRTVYCYSDPDIFLHTLQDQTYDAVLMDIDWNRKESARAKMRVMVKRLLKKYKYPPEGAKKALETVMRQCDHWADEEENVV